ncbi:hypothetical protein GCM10009765_43890 [Fodinicola feengrottensis]|uniref:HTH tetR-type domain-containing protein n=1 Tax=Fodinicola feengrottensis TaxID=435914 RepID=A0ABN2HL41_9ACTN
MRKTAEEAARTRAAVLAAALDSFAENGWDSSTIEGIAQRVGLTRGAVVHHFGDKSSLLRATLVEGWAEQSDRLLAPLLDDSHTPQQRLTNFIANYLVKLRTDPSLRALVVVGAVVAPHIRDHGAGMDDHRQALDVWREHLTRLLRSCTPQPDLSVRHITFSIIALINGAAMEAAIDPAHLPSHAAAKAIAAAAVRGWIAAT